MNPPLRAAADRDAMIEAILDGVVDVIATDHAPHAVHEKEVEFENAPNGITGLETALGLCLRWLHKEWKMPLGRVLSLLSAQPAALLNLKGRGTLIAGSFADVVVFDPKAVNGPTTPGKPGRSPAIRLSTAGSCRARCAGRSAKGGLRMSVVSCQQGHALQPTSIVRRWRVIFCN
jgi:dihydroorotase-like cyclic amidohydrolase